MSSTAALHITAEDVAVLRQIEDDFNRRLWTQLDGDERHFELFDKNLGLRGRLLVGFNALAADFEQARGPRADAQKVARHLARAFDVMLPSLRKCFGDAALIAALPEAATDPRIISISTQVGARGLADLCARKSAA